MKVAGYVLAALLAGLILGSWGMKADLRKARQEMASLEKERGQPETRQTGLEGITSMLKIPEHAPPARAVSRRERPRATAEAGGTNSDRDPSLPAEAPLPHLRPANDEAARAEMQRRIDTASDLWKVRSDLARSVFVSNVATTAEQAAQFDVAMAAMNLRLGGSIVTWANHVKEKKQVTPETIVRMMNDLSSSMVLAYDDLNRAMPPDWPDKAGPNFQVFDFINPEVALPLADVAEMFHAQENRTVARDVTNSTREAQP